MLHVKLEGSTWQSCMLDWTSLVNSSLPIIVLVPAMPTQSPNLRTCDFDADGLQEVKPENNWQTSDASASCYMYYQLADQDREFMPFISEETGKQGPYIDENIPAVISGRSCSATRMSSRSST